MATESIRNLPVPPARWAPEQRAILIDKRPVLRGLVWLRVEGETFALPALQRVLQTEAPPGHRVQIQGGHRTRIGTQEHVLVRAGMVLEVTFSPENPPGTGQEVPQKMTRDSSDPDDNGPRSPDRPGSDSSGIDRAPSPSLSESRRSRTPRQDGPRGPPPPAPVNSSNSALGPNLTGRDDKWTPTLLQHAFPSGKWAATPVLPVTLLPSSCVVFSLLAGLCVTALFVTGADAFLFVIPVCTLQRGPRTSLIHALLFVGVYSQLPRTCAAMQTFPACATAGHDDKPAYAGRLETSLLTRPLPTPCRAKHLPRAGIHAQMPQVGPTLLQHAAGQPDCHAFREARAVLETLQEHLWWHSRDLMREPPQPAQSGQPPVRAKAATIVPPASEAQAQFPRAVPQHPLIWPSLPRHLSWYDEVRIGETRLGFSLYSLHLLLQAKTSLEDLNTARQHAPALNTFDMPALLQDMCRMHRALSHHLWVYTDGSFTHARETGQKRAGWAVAVIDPAQQQVRCCIWTCHCSA